jgi:hypothetical protein
MFTWEAATERLIESSIVTVVQARERAENGMDKTDARIGIAGPRNPHSPPLP